jgi:transcriptional regulator with XRE-family HTH domain
MDAADEERLKTLLAERLPKLRAKHAQTQKDVAAAVDTNEGTVSRWERGEGLPRYAQLVALAKHFNVSADHFTGREPQTAAHAPELPEFREFLKTDLGRVAQERGYIPALLSAEYPYPPTVQLYRALVATYMAHDAESKTPRSAR